MHIALTNLEKTFETSILSPVYDDLLTQHQIELWFKRDDLLHHIISGNKWRKLKYSLNHALSIDTKTLISMGGIYSNHLHALAFVGKALGLKTIGLVRGECPAQLTPTLQDLLDWGMKLQFVSRTNYRQLRQYQSWQDLPQLKPKQYWIPEGGAQPLALAGITELVNEISIPYDLLCAPCGTGTTLAGMIKAVPAHASVLGFSALNHAQFLTDDISKLLPHSYGNWQINFDYHFGGFAKTSTELLTFIDDFESKTGIPLEPIYTGKMLYALYDLIAKKHFKPGMKIIALHTGGLQGNRGSS